MSSIQRTEAELLKKDAQTAIDSVDDSDLLLRAVEEMTEDADIDKQEAEVGQPSSRVSKGSTKAQESLHTEPLKSEHGTLSLAFNLLSLLLRQT